MNKTSPLKLSAAVLSLLLAIAPLRAAEIILDMAKAPAISKSEGTVASAEPAAAGSGRRFEYDFSKGGDTAQYQFVLPQPVEGPLSKIRITAKGAGGAVFFLLRDGAMRPIVYRLGPLTESEQEFTIDPARPLVAKVGESLDFQYPVKGFGFSVKKTGQDNGYIEVLKIAVDTAD